MAFLITLLLMITAAPDIEFGSVVQAANDATVIRAEREHVSVRPIRAKYDAAQTTSENSAYFANADGFSARAANSPAVRTILRNRARYEVANNSYAKGLLSTQVNYIIGTGPTLQVMTDDDAFNEWYEQQFNAWAAGIGWGAKLWTCRHAQSQDGEGFGLFIDNPRLDSPVRLDVVTIEADQIGDGLSMAIDIRQADGIITDVYSNVVGYKILPTHPGDQSWGVAANPIPLPADRMFHLYRVERPGQLRGVPEITPGLMLYPVLRRYTYAALHAAEAAARFAGVLQTKFSPEEAPNVPELESMDLRVNEFMTLPEGWELKQMASEHPSTTYPQFKKEVVIEAARALNIPAGIALGTSEGYNYSSGKLDHVGFFKSVEIEQAAVTRIACEPTLRKWHAEARLISGYAPAGMGNALPPHQWIWDGQEIIDPRENSGQVEALSNGLDSIARLHAKRGLRTDNVFKANAKALGISVDDYRKLLMQKWFGPKPTAPAAESPGSSSDETANARLALRGVA